MKKTLLILLICSYLLATMGFSLKEFYCCGKLKSVSLAFTPEDTKQNCGKGNEKSGCCDNKYHFFKVKDNHFADGDINIPVKHYIVLDLSVPSYQQISFAFQQINVAHRSNAPPLHSRVSPYIFNCVFRI